MAGPKAESGPQQSLIGRNNGRPDYVNRCNADDSRRWKQNWHANDSTECDLVVEESFQVIVMSV